MAIRLACSGRVRKYVSAAATSPSVDAGAVVVKANSSFASNDPVKVTVRPVCGMMTDPPAGIRYVLPSYRGMPAALPRDTRKVAAPRPPPVTIWIVTS